MIEDRLMEENFDTPRITTSIIRGYLVVPIQVELYDQTMLELQDDILEELKEKSIKGVIIDLSGTNVIDLFLAQKIIDTVNMVALMGAETILTGFKPEVAASLVDMDFDFEGIQTALDQDDAFLILESVSNVSEESKEEYDAENP
jgi:rsbT antagonist protein RsbS